MHVVSRIDHIDSRQPDPPGPIRPVWTDPPYGTDTQRTRNGNTYRDLTPAAATDLIVETVSTWVPYLTADATILTSSPS
jgi:hypothetical protein